VKLLSLGSSAHRCVGFMLFVYYVYYDEFTQFVS